MNANRSVFALRSHHTLAKLNVVSFLFVFCFLFFVQVIDRTIALIECQVRYNKKAGVFFWGFFWIFAVSEEILFHLPQYLTFTADTSFFHQTSFNCSLDKDRAVYRMASSGLGVWLSLQSSAVVRLFHATRYESLADVDMAPPVHKMLSGLDFHSSSCDFVCNSILEPIQ